MKTKAKKTETGKSTTAADVVKNGKPDFKAQAEARAKSKQQERLAFVAEHGKRLADLWAKEDRPTSMGIWRKAFPKAEQPCRMVDYVLVALGIRETTDKGLLAWKSADGFNPSAQPARPNPAPKKSEVVKTKKA